MLKKKEKTANDVKEEDEQAMDQQHQHLIKAVNICIKNIKKTDYITRQQQKRSAKQTSGGSVECQATAASSLFRLSFTYSFVQFEKNSVDPKMAAISSKFFPLVLFILYIFVILQQLTTAFTTQTPIPAANASNNKNETEVRCQKWVKNGETVNAETGMQHPSFFLVLRN